MSEAVTKEDLKQFSLLIFDKIEFLFKNTNLVKKETKWRLCLLMVP